jgi:multidrug resistance efflux pump
MNWYCFSRWPWCLGIVLLVAGAAGAGWGYLHSAAARPPQEHGPAPAAGGLPGVVCFGHADLEHGITALYPAQPGRVSEVPVSEGDEVAAGTVLVRLEDRLPRARVEEAEAAVEAARTQLAQAREAAGQHEARVAQLQAATEALKYRQSAAEHQRDYKEELFERRLIGEKELAVARDQVKETAALLWAEREKLKELQLHDPALDVRRAEAEAAVVRARLVQAREALEQCAVKAPAAGTVLRILVNPGEMLGVAARGPAVQFCPGGPRLIRAEVDQEFAGCAVVGREALVQDDSRDGEVWRGKVVRVSDWYTQRRSIVQEPLQVNDVRTLECLIALDPDQPPVRIGQRVRVRLGTKVHSPGEGLGWAP